MAERSTLPAYLQSPVVALGNAPPSPLRKRLDPKPAPGTQLPPGADPISPASMVSLPQRQARISGVARDTMRFGSDMGALARLSADTVTGRGRPTPEDGAAVDRLAELTPLPHFQRAFTAAMDPHAPLSDVLSNAAMGTFTALPFGALEEAPARGLLAREAAPRPVGRTSFAEAAQTIRPDLGVNSRGVAERARAAIEHHTGFAAPAPPGGLNPNMYPYRLWQQNNEMGASLTRPPMVGRGADAQANIAAHNDAIPPDPYWDAMTSDPESIIFLDENGNVSVRPPSASERAQGRWFPPEDIPNGSPDAAADPMFNLGGLPRLQGDMPPPSASGRADMRWPQFGTRAPESLPRMQPDANQGRGERFASLRGTVDPSGSLYAFTDPAGREYRVNIQRRTPDGPHTVDFTRNDANSTRPIHSAQGGASGAEARSVYQHVLEAVRRDAAATGRTYRMTGAEPRQQELYKYMFDHVSPPAGYMAERQGGSFIWRPQSERATLADGSSRLPYESPGALPNPHNGTTSRDAQLSNESSARRTSDGNQAQSVRVYRGGPSREGSQWLSTSPSEAEAFARLRGGDVTESEVDPRGFLVVDGEGRNWDRLPIPTELPDARMTVQTPGHAIERATTDSVARAAKKAGYPGVHFRNVAEETGTPADHFVVFDRAESSTRPTSNGSAALSPSAEDVQPIPQEWRPQAEPQSTADFDALFPQRNAGAASEWASNLGMDGNRILRTRALDAAPPTERIPSYQVPLSMVTKDILANARRLGSQSTVDPRTIMLGGLAATGPTALLTTGALMGERAWEDQTRREDAALAQEHALMESLRHPTASPAITYTQAVPSAGPDIAISPALRRAAIAQVRQLAGPNAPPPSEADIRREAQIIQERLRHGPGEPLDAPGQEPVRMPPAPRAPSHASNGRP